MTPPPLAPIDRSVHVRRARAALEHVAAGLIVTHRANVRWLTGFTGSAGAVLLTPDELVLVTDGRYGDQAREQVDGASVRVVVTREISGSVADLFADVDRVALEGDVTWALQRTIDTEWLPSAELVPTEQLLGGLRSTKQESEIERIRLAANTTDRALAALLADGLTGRTEAALAWDIEGRMRELGADRAGYELIVASGPNGAHPHHEVGARTVLEGDLVVVDVGAEVDGYRSDMTRTFVIGKPSPRQRQLLEAVRGAQERGLAAVRPGVPGSEVDAQCRTVLADAGLAENFVHGAGHGVGLEIHEPPILGRKCTAELVESSVITIEPGVYFPGEGGVRIEDTVLVTAAGAEHLTNAPKEPVVV